MEGLNLIQDLGIVLLAAGIAGSICRRLGLSVVVGYLVAGIFVGPFTPPFSFVSDLHSIHTLSQVGLVFLMFGIGLELSISKLGRMGWPILVATAAEAMLMLGLTLLLGRTLGWNSNQALFVAGMFMVSSSAVIAKMVGDLNLGHERSGQLALGVAILEDVVAVIMLTVLAARTGDGPSTSVGSVLTSMSAFIALLVGVGLLMVPRLLRRLEARADPELQTIVVAGVLFLLALAAAKAGYSLALGAFLLGAIVAEIPQKAAVEKSFHGMRDLFSSVFFVAIGMLIDLKLLLEVWPLALGLGVFVLVARALATGLALILCGIRPRDARRAGLLLTPLGEFSFIIAQLGVSAAVLPANYYPMAVGVSIFTVLFGPLVNRHAERILDFGERLEPVWMRRALAAYHDWVAQIRNTAEPSMAWKLIRGRLGQIALEVLLVTGVMTSSRQLLDLLLRQADAFGVQPQTLIYLFWGSVALIALIPLVALWRNVTTVAMIVGENVGGAHVPSSLVQSAITAIAALMLGAWIYAIVPTDRLGGWGWVAIGLIAAVITAVFSSRLIYWHSQWQSSVREVLAEDAGGPGGAASQARAQRAEDLQAWNVQLGECIVPDAASYAGQTLAQLSIPAKFGCAVIELERNGIVITAIRPDLRLYPGDKLLLLGRSEQIRTAGEFLTREKAVRDQADEFRGSVLETFAVPPGPWHERTLAELKLAQRTGVRVVGIQRGEQRIIAPSGEEQLHENDHVLVAGTLAEIGNFRRWLRSKETTASSPAVEA